MNILEAFSRKAGQFTVKSPSTGWSMISAGLIDGDMVRPPESLEHDVRWGETRPCNKSMWALSRAVGSFLRVIGRYLRILIRERGNTIRFSF